MSVTTAPAESSPVPERPRSGVRRRPVSGWFYRHPRLRVALLLVPPLLWLGVVYLGSLLALLVQSFYAVDDFTGQVDESFTLQTWERLLTRANFDVMFRTAGMAAAVTVASAIIAFPLAYFMARVARNRTKTWLFVAILLPLWSSYLVRVYAWKLILAKEGVFTWFVDRLGLNFALDWVLDLPTIGGPSLSVSLFGQWIVFVYIWLPYMILPIEAALERVPASVVEASGDLGARNPTTLRRIIWPLAIPGVIAGSIFTFSLTLGDYIIPTIIGDSSPSIGASIYIQQGTAGNLPLAAAWSVVPMVIMAVYLMLARRLGAFEAL
ncbi:MAG TPA: ABC transporter permease [Acidimicrobiia bacterium]|nr:ABC transporter permease [Acidimicrobiia bacterium]